MKKTVLLFVLMLTLLLTHNLWATDSCEIAWQMAQQAATTFSKDKPAGLKLFIKAQQFCPEDAGLNYNLGMAYAEYGHPAEALPWLEKAVQGKQSTAIWSNNLASLLLQLGKDSPRALQLAQQAAKNEDSLFVQLTLVRAQLANGDAFAALQTVDKLKKTGSFAAETTFIALAGQVVDSYLSAALQLVRDGQVEPGLKLLEKGDFCAQVALARVEVLARLNRHDQALAAVDQYQHFAALRTDLDGVRDQVFSAMTRGLYEQFQRGESIPAYAAAKDLADKYPQVAVVTKTEHDLWGALIADAKSIEVPQAIAPRRLAVATGQRADDLLSGIGQLSNTGTAIDLRVDVDEDIPQGKKAGRYDVAVVIGNSIYSQAPNVEYASHDARIMRKYLEQTFGFDTGNIIYAENAGLAKFNEIFGNRVDYKGQLYRYVKENQSRVFVYYVGHGAPDLETEESFFVPVDANPQYLKNSGYRVQTFYDNLAKLPVKSLTVVLDACFSGKLRGNESLHKGISPGMLRVKDASIGMDNAVVFASSQSDEVSAWYPAKRHSLFTYYFLKGLGGQADNNGDKQLTVAELKKYLLDEVPYASHRLNSQQTPMIHGDGAQIVAQLK